MEKKSQTQRRRRLNALERFGKWTRDTYGVEPKTLLTRARRGGRSPDKAERVLRQYCKFLVDRGNAKGSAVQWYALLRRYFTANGVNLGKYPKLDVRPTYEEEEPMLSRDRVGQIVKSCDSPRDRFVLAFLLQTGQRIGVLAAMNRNMITKVASGHGMVKVPKTFPNRLGENANTLEREYAFIVGQDTMKLLAQLDLDRRWWDKEGNLKLSARQMSRIVDKAADAIGIQDKQKTKMGRSWSAVHSNTFRKYYKDCMVKAGSDPSCFIHMMGNRVPSVLSSSELTDDKLLEAYKKAEGYLEVL